MTLRQLAPLEQLSGVSLNLDILQPGKRQIKEDTLLLQAGAFKDIYNLFTCFNQDSRKRRLVIRLKAFFFRRDVPQEVA